MRSILSTLLLLVISCTSPLFVAIQPLRAQIASPGDDLDDLQSRAQTMLYEAHRDGLDALAVKNYDRARRAFDEAENLRAQNGDASLMAIKYKVTIDEIEAGRQSAQHVRERVPTVIAARAAARDAGADTLTVTGWQRAEQELNRIVREIESGRTVEAADADAVAGAYRAARRDGLRRGVLNDAWQLRDQIDQRRGEKVLPTLTLRVHQAISRAEAAISQENLDLARIEGANAAYLARHTLDVLDHVERAQTTGTAWESAILPYDDILLDVARQFDTRLDFSKGVTAAAQPMNEHIKTVMDSLRRRITELDESNRSLEASLSESQTSLADAQNRIVELERRMASAEGERSETRAKLQLTEQMTRARQQFGPGEASVLQNDQGQVVLRLLGLRFAAGATKLDKSASKLLDKAVAAVGEFPGAALAVEGHTDSDGGEEQNQKLSAARAKAVSNYLAKALKIPTEQITATGFGESLPIADNKTRDGKAMNRRVEIVLTLP